jgi:AraC family transcriptional regulator, regulatory protein of adaptative response / methylated-DNA-[protein]-cysteine methyltransferase
MTPLPSLDAKIPDPGLEANADFREAFDSFFYKIADQSPAAPGQAPAKIDWMESRLGPLLIGATEGGVCLLEFSDKQILGAQGQGLATRLGHPYIPGTNGYIASLKVELTEYFEGKRREFSVPIEETGTPFQKRVWAALRTIPYGKTWSYAELALTVGNPRATRAVARANGMNRVAILVPCHRVIASGGGWGGYSGGLWRKRRLLESEGSLDEVTIDKGRDLPFH